MNDYIIVRVPDKTGANTRRIYTDETNYKDEPLPTGGVFCNGYRYKKLPSSVFADMLQRAELGDNVGPTDMRLRMEIIEDDTIRALLDL